MSNITMWGPNWSPRNWMPCDGRLLAISQFTAMFSLIGTIYGGDGRTTFGLPDLRGRAAIGYGTGPGLTPRVAGQMGGQEWVTLNTLEMPQHTHTTTTTATGTGSADLYASSGDGTNTHPAAGDSLSGDGGYSATIYGTGTPDTKLASLSIQNVAASVNVSVGLTGGSQSHANMQPWQSVGFIICYQGIYPSRN